VTGLGFGYFSNSRGLTPRSYTKTRLSGRGDVGTLAELRTLTHLDLSFTSVSGSVERLVALTQLTQLHLRITQVSGSVEPLAALTQLTQLDLGYTLVSGSVEPLVALTQLTHLYLDGNAKIYGLVEPLAALTQLTALYLQGTCVSGDPSAIQRRDDCDWSRDCEEGTAAMTDLHLPTTIAGCIIHKAGSCDAAKNMSRLQGTCVAKASGAARRANGALALLVWLCCVAAVAM
jgi:hypothetical protein